MRILIEFDAPAELVDFFNQREYGTSAETERPELSLVNRTGQTIALVPEPQPDGRLAILLHSRTVLSEGHDGYIDVAQPLAEGEDFRLS